MASPLTVTGHTALSSFEVELTDASGNVLTSETVTPSSGSFSVTLRFAVNAPQAGAVAAFEPNAGGLRGNLTQVPVRLTD